MIKGGSMIKKKFIKKVSVVVALLIALQSSSLTAFANDSWPFSGDAAHGKNQPSVKGYTSGQIASWSPETEPHAEALRSRVPLQKRIDPLSATQANPALPSEIQMFNLAGDYGNAFIENAPYTNKFARYHFNFWQYIDYYSYWHGTATPYTPPEYYDDTAKSNWQQKWFEFGMLNIPDPTYTDAAHKNGVMSIATIFFSNNDRGQQTYKQMLVKDANGKFPVAEKMIEMANYFGYDGYFFNQEEQNPNVDVADIPDYIAFMQTIVDAGLYVNWYDSLNTSTGSNSFQDTFTNNNIRMLYDNGKQTSHSFFANYTLNSTKITNSINFLNNFNTANATSFNMYDNYFAGIEAGSDGVDGAHWAQGNQNAVTRAMDSNGIPRTSYASLGTDFVHSDLDRDMGLKGDSNADYGNPKAFDYKHNTDYQWMTTVREQLWWSGPNLNPANTAVTTSNKGADVYADTTKFKGFAQALPEKSSIGGSNFYTSFSVGRGMRYYKEGQAVGEGEWSNMSMQDTALTWQWWQETNGTELALDFDYGQGVKIDPSRQSYSPIGGYNGGNSLVINGKLDDENLIRLYKTDLELNANSKFDIVYNKTSVNDASELSVALIFKDDTSSVVKIPVQNSGEKTNGWKKATLDLSAYAGKNIAVIGLNLDNNSAAINDYQINIGQIRVYDSTAVKAAAPTGLTVSQAISNTNEMFVKWDIQSYDDVKLYNIYVNDVMVGGKYDEIFYIKNLPAKSGKIKVVPVGADGLEGNAAEIPFDITNAASNISVDSKADGTLTVSWDNTANITGDIKVTVKNVNLLDDQPVNAEKTVPAGSTNVVFDNMPVNGDDYTVTVQIGSSNVITENGRFIDVVCKPYAEQWSVSGNQIDLPMPNTRDWRYLYVYEDGVAKSFATTYSAGNKPMIVRGRSTKASLSFNSTAKTVYVVMEDYAGNQSEPVFIKSSSITASEFPDPILRQWVIDNVGDGTTATTKDLNDFKGTIDLTGLGIADFTGLGLIQNAEELIISGNPLLTNFNDPNNVPRSIKTLKLTDNPNLEFIQADAFVNTKLLKTLDISGSSALKYVDIKGSSVETLIADDIADYTDLIYLDITGTNADIETDSSLWKFVKDMLDKIDGSTATVSVPKFTTVSQGIVPAGSGFTNTQVLTDGVKTGSSFASASTFPAEVTIDMGSEVEVSAYRHFATSNTYAPKAFTISYSTDNVNFTDIKAETNITSKDYETKFAPVKGQYFKLTVTAGASYYGVRLNEIEFDGIKYYSHPATVNFDGTMPDNTLLVQKIEQAEKLKEIEYSPASWKKLTEQIKTAKDVAENGYSTQAEINTAFNDLDNTILSLVKVNFKVLKDTVAKAEKLLAENALDNTIPSVVTEFNNALADAKGLFDADPVTQLEVNTATMRLLSVMGKVDWKAGFKGSLEILVELAEDIDLDKYLDTGKTEFTNALQKANDVLADPDAFAQEIDEAYDDLLDALFALKMKADKTLLKSAVVKAQGIDTSLYTKDSIDALSTVLADAVNVLENEQADQDEVNAAAQTLTKAIANLSAKANKTSLKAAIDQANSVNLLLYTPESTENFSQILENAVKVFDDEKSDQATVNTATDKLIEAIMKLKLKADKSLLESDLAKAKVIDTSLYTKESADTLALAIADAEKILKDDNASQNEVDNATLSLANSIVGLKLKSSETSEESKNENSNNSKDESKNEDKDSKEESKNNNSNNSNNSKDKGNNSTGGKSPSTGSESILTAVIVFVVSGVLILISRRKKAN